MSDPGHEGRVHCTGPLQEASTPERHPVRELAEELSSLHSWVPEDFEAVLRRRLPAVSSLLGELATLRKCVGTVLTLTRIVKDLGPAELMQLGEEARAALAPASGRLAGEVLVLAHRVWEEGPRSEFDGRSATGIVWFDELLDELGATVDEMGAAYPEIRETPDPAETEEQRGTWETKGDREVTR